MSNLISRREAIKAIEDLQDCYNGFSDTYDKACIIGVLEELPSAQPESCKYWDSESNFCALYRPSAQPELIRCKDCKHFYYDMPYVIQGIPVLGHEVCDFWGDGCKTSENGFCSYAERRTDNERFD